MTSERVSSVVSGLEAIGEDARSAFGGLTAAELNWKRDDKNWSIAQCLDHLIVINSLYFPVFEKLRSPDVPNTLLEKLSPLSSFFGRFLIKAMSPETQKKTKTSKKAYPSSSDLGADIVERFVNHNHELGERISDIAPEVNLTRIITSPLAGFVTYSLDDCLTMLVVHEQRHLLQARRVVEGLESRLAPENF